MIKEILITLLIVVILSSFIGMIFIFHENVGQYKICHGLPMSGMDCPQSGNSILMLINHFRNMEISSAAIIFSLFFGIAVFLFYALLTAAYPILVKPFNSQCLSLYFCSGIGNLFNKHQTFFMKWISLHENSPTRLM